MNCAQFELRLVDIAAGRSEAGRAGRAHLAQCARCTGLLHEQRSVTASLRDFAAASAGLDAPAAVERALLDALRRHPDWRTSTRARSVPRRGSWPAAIAACMLAAVSLLATTLHQAVVAPPAGMADLRLDGVPTAIATPFYPLRPASTQTAPAHGMIRTHLPRATLLAFGLPCDPRRADEPIMADLLLDTSGMVLAVRFVQTPASIY